MNNFLKLSCLILAFLLQVSQGIADDIADKERLAICFDDALIGYVAKVTNPQDATLKDKIQKARSKDSFQKSINSYMSVAGDMMALAKKGGDVESDLRAVDAAYPGISPGFLDCYNNIFEKTKDPVKSEAISADDNENNDIVSSGENIKSANVRLVCRGKVTQEYHAFSPELKYLDSITGKQSDRIESVENTSFFIDVKDGVLIDSDWSRFGDYLDKSIISYNDSYIDVTGGNPNDGSPITFRISRKTGNLGIAGNGGNIDKNISTEGKSGFYLMWVFDVVCEKGEDAF